MDLAFNNQLDARRDTLSLSPCIYIWDEGFQSEIDEKKRHNDVDVYLLSSKCLKIEVWKGGLFGRGVEA